MIVSLQLTSLPLLHGYQITQTYLSVKATVQEGCKITCTQDEAQQKYLSAASIEFVVSCALNTRNYKGLACLF